MLDELDPRDGPTKEFLTHHQVTHRARAAGKRVTGRLEIMLNAGDITPAEFDAGDRFAQAYNVGGVGGEMSVMYRSPGGSGDGLEWKMDMARTLREATAALLSAHAYVGWKWDENGAAVGGLSPGQFMVHVCVLDTSFKELGRLLDLHEERVRTQAAKMLQTLARHFEDVDKKRGVSRTPGTRDQIAKRLDPEDDV